MMDWMSANSDLVNIVLNALMTLVWLIYLHLLLTGARRQRRTNIHINRSAGNGDEAECVITNMGAEPIYLIDIIADLSIDGGTHSTVVTDRDELGEDDLSDMLEKSNQVPLNSGEHRAVGNFRNLVWRAINHLDLNDCQDEIDTLKLTVVVAGHENQIAAAEKEYYVVTHKDGRHKFIAQSMLTTQLRSMRKRRHIQKRMEANLRLESEQAQEREDERRAA
ncbi:hypothetical protein ACW9UR_11985 [Halovulum sp. GXIMD14794]